MIAVLLAAFQQANESNVYELFEPGKTIVVQAYIKPYDLNEKELAAWYVLGSAVLKGTVELSPQKIREFGSQAGVAPEVLVMPDFMRIQFVVPVGGLSLAGDLLSSVMLRCTLLDSDVQEAIRELQASRQEPWMLALTGIRPSFEKLRATDVRNLWSRTFVAKSVSFVVGGEVQNGEGRREIEKRFSRWSPSRPGARIAGVDPRALLSTNSRLSTFLLSAKTLTPASPSSAAKLLSVFALGVGKDATMQRVLREQLGLSYMQFAVLWPTINGWRPSFVMVRKAEKDDAEHAVNMRDAMLADIDKWTEETALRAQAMAESAFARNLSNSPVWLGSDGPMTNSLQDRCAWRGYLQMVGSGALDERVLVSSLKNVDVEQLKSAAKALLDECNVGWLPGAVRN